MKCVSALFLPEINFEMPTLKTAYNCFFTANLFSLLQAEKLLKKALKSGDMIYRKSQSLQHHSTAHDAEHRELNSAASNCSFFTFFWRLFFNKC